MKTKVFFYSQTCCLNHEFLGHVYHGFYDNNCSSYCQFQVDNDYDFVVDGESWGNWLETIASLFWGLNHSVWCPIITHHKILFLERSPHS